MKNHKKTVVVTGSAGFIGSHICELLLNEGWRVVGVDSLSDFYDVELKKHREKRLLAFMDYRSVHKMIEEPGLLLQLFKEERPDVVIHLAAQAGVRHSIEQPRAYLESNIIGTFELLEAARAFPPSHMLLASTSSAYGANKDMPYFETAKADHQISFYAATKKATENMAHSYAHLYNLPISIFRFFTVYGPRGRPDMALFKFTKAIISDEKIDIYNNGEMSRDFTYVDDLVYATRLLIDKVPTQPSSGIVTPGDSLSPVAPFRCVNIGNSRPIKLLQYIRVIEKAIGKKSIHNFMPMQAGDVSATWADTTLLKSLTGYTPQTSVDDGVIKFVAWYRDYYNV
jgi:UDP-glucuronate 4-epimerase